MNLTGLTRSPASSAPNAQRAPSRLKPSGSGLLGIARASALAIASLLAGCVPGLHGLDGDPKVAGDGADVATGDPQAIAPDADLVAAPIDFARWKGLNAGCSYLAPKSDFVGEDGGVDVVFHFHAGQMSEAEMKTSGANAVFVSCGYGIGSGAYSEAFAHPARFEQMVNFLVRSIEKDTDKKGLHVRRLGLVSWSAGFAAVGKILGVDRYYAMVDSVVLLDSLHAQYREPNPHTALQGADHVDTRGLAPFIRFAKDAANGTKTMVITHSSIVPPDYASSAEATEALLTAVGVPRIVVSDGSSTHAGPEQGAQADATASAVGAGASSDGTISHTNERGMTTYCRADVGNLHVRGFRGRGPRDHFAHLHLIGEVLRSWVVPRWKREDRLVYTLARE